MSHETCGDPRCEVCAQEDSSKLTKLLARLITPTVPFKSIDDSWMMTKLGPKDSPEELAKRAEELVGDKLPPRVRDLLITQIESRNKEVFRPFSLKVVKALTEDQCRYALWMCLLMVFGDRDNKKIRRNLLDHGMSYLLPVADGQTLLSQLTCYQTNERELRGLELEHKEQTAEVIANRNEQLRQAAKKEGFARQYGKDAKAPEGSEPYVDIRQSQRSPENK